MAREPQRQEARGRQTVRKAQRQEARERQTVREHQAVRKAQRQAARVQLRTVRRPQAGREVREKGLPEKIRKRKMAAAARR